nr:MAG TPA: hypothetical protein [Caudoviricetes sp.]DAJ58850.1 MAG TPA: hypothetical protein [Caudoviricetes sp.]
MLMNSSRDIQSGDLIRMVIIQELLTMDTSR